MQGQVAQYIKKWKWLIVAFCIAAMGVTYMALHARQTYTASVVIEYTNSSASEHYNLDGTPIDPTEIYAAKTVSKALESMNSDASVDSVRSKITVTEVIPETEQEKIDAAIKNGDEYTYNPTQYTVSYVSSVSRQDARTVLSKVLSAYFEDYGETHVATVGLPADCASLIKSNYDYLENAEIIKSAVDNMMGYLKTQKESYPNWRSALTGYTFSDLYAEYKDLSDSKISGLFAQILQDKATKDYEVLIHKYQKRIASDTLQQENDQERLDKLTELLSVYTKTIESANDSTTTNTGEGSNVLGNVLDNVYDSDNKTNEYDTLVNEYVSVSEEHDQLTTDIGYCNMILSTYGDSADSATVSDNTVSDLQTNTADAVSSLYKLVSTSYTEFNAYLGAANIGTVSSVAVADGIPMKLFMLIAAVLFLMIGCIGAMTIGRITEFVHDAVYIDEKTGLNNRYSADAYIARTERSPYATMAVLSLFITNLQEINANQGRKSGDELLKLYGKAIQFSAKNNSFANYNGAGRFFLFLPNSSPERAEAIAESIRLRLHDISSLPIQFRYGVSQTEQDREMSIHRLIALAAERSNQVKDDEKA